MKTLVKLLSSLTLSTSIVPLSTGNAIKDKIDTQHNAITLSLNYNYHVTGGITSYWTEDISVVTLINYKSYANSWTEFVQKYPHFRLLNFTAKASGQTYEKDLNDFAYETKDLSWYSWVKILEMNSTPWFVGHQNVKIYYKFTDVNGFMILDFWISTLSTNCVKSVWANISASDAVFYN